MNKFQKVGVAVVAFCLTVAVTSRVQQEVDKKALENTPTEPRVGYWLYEEKLPDGTYGFAHHGPKGTTFWAAKVVKIDPYNPIDGLFQGDTSSGTPDKPPDRQTGATRLSPQQVFGKDSTEFNVWADELVVHQEHGPTQHFKIVRRVR